MLQNFYMIAGIVGTILAAVYGLMKYVFHSIDEHKEAVTERFDEHAEKLKENKNAIRENELAVNNVRDEIHKEYVHKDEHREDYKNLTEAMNENFKAVFHKVDGLARDVNRLIGKVQKGQGDAED